MKLYFNADEVFEMAEEIERQGASFYQKAAGVFKDAAVKEMLAGLSAMEVGHEKLFTNMRSQILSDTYQGYDPDQMAAAYIKAFTEGKVFNFKKNMADLVTEKSTLEDILKLALEAEKNSIIFYTGIKKIVPENFGKDAIDKIIAEEMKHIVMLVEKMANL
ncbi:MAG TPA: ferritin family protein [Deltaproteobacteria bacterium]|nr:ferritin family protein [Deltaproteobacteria bacterium]HOI05706.1 ferritin family protein [Deltaproteobacteria bacterium]